jgi:hypothetical protein
MNKATNRACPADWPDAVKLRILPSLPLPLRRMKLRLPGRLVRALLMMLLPAGERAGGGGTQQVTRQ